MSFCIFYHLPAALFCPGGEWIWKKRLQAIRDGAWWRRSCGSPAFMLCIRPVCFRIESVRPGTELFVSSDRFASRVLIIRKWPDQSPFFTLSALLGRGCTVGLKGMHRWFERDAPLVWKECTVTFLPMQALMVGVTAYISFLLHLYKIMKLHFCIFFHSSLSWFSISAFCFYRLLAERKD